MVTQKKDPGNMRRIFTRMLVLVIVLWTAVCAGSMLYLNFDSELVMERIARETARTYIEKDLLYRYWAAELGGIYVPVTEQTPANPYLSGVKERDITTPSGRRLTLLHPAAMMRQVLGLGRRFTKIQGHMASLKPLHPENAPDAWEANALRALESDAKEFGEFVDYQGTPHYRMMYPLVMVKPCLSCHAAQGYKLGDLRGGIAAFLPMEMFASMSHDHHLSMVRQFAGMWILGFICIFASAPLVRRRIVEQEQAEEALQRNLHFTQSIIENEPECVKILDRDGNVLFVNPAGLAMVDAVSSHGVVGRPMGQFVVPEHREAFIRLHKQVFVGESGRLEFETVGLKGTHRWMQTHAVPIRNADGTVESLLAITRDVTERRLAEQALRESEERFRVMFESAPDASFLADPASGTIIDVNAGAERLLQRTRDEIIGMHQSQLHAWDLQMAARQDLAQRTVWNSADLAGDEIVRKDGTIVPVDISTQVFSIAGKQVVMGVFRDVTERKRAELELFKALNLNQTLIDSLPYPSALISYPERTILAANRLARENGSEIGARCYQGFNMGADLTQGTEPCSFCRAEEMFANMATVVTQELLIKERWWTVYWVPVDRSTYLRFSIDITERKRLEQQLLQSHKMDSVGRLAGGIAHDINNMLMPILGYAELLKEKLPDGDESREDLDEITSAARRVRTMTLQLLAFARKQTLEMVRLDLNEVISDFSPMLQMTFRENISLTVRLASSVRPILGDKSQVEQVIMNLAVNARDAMPSGGTFVLATQDRVVNEAYAARRPGMVPGTYVQLLATDTGIGMNEDTRSNIFEPFFTTKNAGQGTGLGLATVYGIVKQHSGYIEVRSEWGVGTEFIISLPVNNTPVEESAEAAEEQLVQKGSETVLVVEDQPQVLQLVSLMLTTRGYHVLTANSGQEALRTTASYAGEIHLVVTDVVMPDMNGKELFERIRQARQGIRVLYMSGYPADVISKQGVLETGINFLRKSFSAKELTVKVRQVLDSSGKG
jgi:PAS domain S-box-containing protein